MTKRFEGKVVLVTGASSGIGRTTAIAFGREGARVAVAARRRERLEQTLAQLREGRTLSEAYSRALVFTGKVVMLTGLTLAAGVATWVASPIKFQADMGLLLAFMFLWNMLGALVLLPALANLLLKPARKLERAPAPAHEVPA